MGDAADDLFDNMMKQQWEDQSPAQQRRLAAYWRRVDRAEKIKSGVLIQQRSVQLGRLMRKKLEHLRFEPRRRDTKRS